MTNPVDTLGNVKVDFVWGNMPLQPNDVRGMAQLDPALDNHITATDGWQGYPGYEPNTGFAPQAVVAPTTNWDWDGMRGRFYFNAISSIPGGVSGSGAMGFNLVITGGAWAGTYGLGNGAIDNAGPTFYVQTSPGFPAGSLSVDGAADGGLASIVAK